MYDTAENTVSTTLALVNELTVYNIEADVPTAWKTTYPVAGWLQVRMSNTAPYDLTDWDELEWLCYVYMNANDTSASLNWSTLWADRQVGTN